MSNYEINPKPWESYHAIYIHIPFCRQKCFYCDFASYAGLSKEVMTAYTRALCREIAVRSTEAERTSENATIYFGGGTPSILPNECLDAIVSALRQANFWREPQEATIEANPGTVSTKSLKFFRQLGFNRISLGIQSLRDTELHDMGRIHTSSQALEAIAMAREAGFSRISGDVIYGYPRQTISGLQFTLERLLAERLMHLSVYGLIVEEGTQLANFLLSGKLVLPNEDEIGDMYDLVQILLKEAGFERYEISNYAREGEYSRHNIVYWKYYPYIGFGAAACSFDGSSRFTAINTVPGYIAEANKISPVDIQISNLYQHEILTKDIQLEEFIFLGLRRNVGVDLLEGKERFGVDIMQHFGKELEPLIKQELVVYENTGRLRLTERGMAVGNRIFEIFVTD